MNKSILFTLVILVGLFLVYLFSGGNYVDTLPKEESDGFSSFKGIDLGAVERITIAKGKTDPVELVKHADGWKVKNRWDAAADQKKIEDMLTSMEGIQTGTRAGKSAESHRNFEVDKLKGGFIHLYEKGGKKLGDVVVGKTAPSANFRETYVFARFNGEDSTYKVKSDIRSKASLYSDVEPKGYLKTKIFELSDDDELYQVRLVREGKDELIVERRYRVKEEEKKDEEKPSEAGAEGADKAPGDKEAEKKEPEKEEYFVVTSGHETHDVGDSEKWSARGLVDRAKTIRIEDVVEPKELSEYGLEKAQLIAVVSFRKKDVEDAESRTVTLLFGNAYKDDKGEDKGYYMNLKGAEVDSNIYKISKWDFDSWKKELKDFLPKPKKEEKKEEGDGSEKPAAPAEKPAAPAEKPAAPAEKPAAPAEKPAAPAEKPAASPPDPAPSTEKAASGEAGAGEPKGKGE